MTTNVTFSPRNCRRCGKRSQRLRSRKRRSSDWRFFTLCGIRRCRAIRSTASSICSANRMCRTQRCAPSRRRSCTLMQCASVCSLLITTGFTTMWAQMVHVMLHFAGADQRQDDLFGNENFFSKGKSALKGLKVRQRSARHASICGPHFPWRRALASLTCLSHRASRMYIRNIRRIWPKRSIFS